eukprot:737898-Lingulodinium_polyedra.AAC.1
MLSGDQAGLVIQDMQEKANLAIGRMSQDQVAAQRRIDEVIVSAERKFAEVDAFLRATQSGVGGVADFARQLEAQQA